MDSIFTTKTITEQHIQSLVKDGAEESNELEFKSSGSLDRRNPQCKEEISKDVSAFANSAGGVIVYGIEEGKNRKAKGLSFIDGETYTQEWLDQIVNAKIQRRINGFRIDPIRIDGDIKKTIYAITIPESDNVPHMAADGKYYRRSNATTVRMDEYEVRHAYFRRSKSKLEITLPVLQQPFGNPEYRDGNINKVNTLSYSLDFQVRNIGSIVEKDYVLEFWIPELVYFSPPGWDNTLTNKLYRREGEYIIFAIANERSIFPNQLVTVARAFISVNLGKFNHLEQCPLKLKLYYTSGVDERETIMTDWLTYLGNPLTREVFGF